MRHFMLVAAAYLLTACSALSLAPVIDSNARSYHQVVEDVTNSILVTNILRARDHAPLHYSDLSTINGSLQGTAGASAIFPIGLQTSPSFTLGTLDTDDFTRGILTPVTPDVIKYFLDQGLDPRIAFLVFFEAVRGYGVELRNDDGRPIDTHGKIDNAPDNGAEFKKFLTIANYEDRQSSTQGFYANSYRELRPIGTPFTLDMKASYKDVAGFDFTKVRLAKIGNKGEYQLYSISPTTKLVFCRRAFKPGGAMPAHASPSQEKYTVDGYRIFGLADTLLPDDPRNYSEVCRKTEVVVGSGTSPIVPVLYPRSPQGIVEYLGALLRYQNAHRDRVPITLSRDPASGALFTLSTTPSDSRFGVPYRGTTYYVGKATPRDHTLEVLALLNQLFDLYKSAKDIPSIRPVTIIP
jgi:hypothetical protein